MKTLRLTKPEELDYKVERMALYREKEVFGDRKFFKYTYGMYFSREEKINFIDKYIALTDRDMNKYKNCASYMLALIKKYNEEKDSLKKNSWGGVKENSLKAWLRKNDLQGMVDVNYEPGRYRIAGYKEYRLDGSDTVYDEEPVSLVDSWFTRLLCELEKKERNYFFNTDPVAQGIKKIKEYEGKYGCLGNNRISSIAGNGYSYLENGWLKWTKYSPVDINEVEKILKLYEKLEKFNNELAAEAMADNCIHNNFDECSNLSK